jgi:hypothetical protein
MKLRAALVAMAALLALGVGQVLAQYPPPAGNILAQPANPNPMVNSETQVTVSVQSQAGVPASNVGCIASIASQPGKAAAVSPSFFNTDSAGKATLSVFTGDTPGQVRIGIDCGGLSTNAVLAVRAETSAPLPPDTGQGVQAAGGGTSSLPIAFCGLVFAAGAAGVLVRQRLRVS